MVPKSIPIALDEDIMFVGSGVKVVNEDGGGSKEGTRKAFCFYIHDFPQTGTFQKKGLEAEQSAKKPEGRRRRSKPLEHSQRLSPSAVTVSSSATESHPFQ